MIFVIFLIVFFINLIKFNTQINNWKDYLIDHNSLRASLKKIKTLKGIENLDYLEIINLSNNQIKMKTELENLTLIYHLNLEKNKTSDITPLQKFNSLFYILASKTY